VLQRIIGVPFAGQGGNVCYRFQGSLLPVHYSSAGGNPWIHGATLSW